MSEERRVSPIEKSERSLVAKVALTIVALAVVVSSGVGVRWWTHPSIFDGGAMAGTAT